MLSSLQARSMMRSLMTMSETKAVAKYLNTFTSDREREKLMKNTGMIQGFISTHEVSDSDVLEILIFLKINGENRRQILNHHVNGNPRR